MKIAFQFNSVAFTDLTAKPLSKRQFVSIQPIGSGVDSMQNADQFGAMQADRGKLTVQITLAKAASHHSVIKSETSSIASQIGVFFAYLSTLLSLGKLFLNTFECKVDPTVGLIPAWGGSSFKVARDESKVSSAHDIVASPGIEMATAERDNAGQPSEDDAFPSAPSVPSEENDIEEQLHEQRQKQDGAARPHAASIHDLR